MYKILCYLVAFTLSGTYGTFGQRPPTAPTRPDYPVDMDAHGYPASEEITSRKTAFIVHLLADRVDSGKKYVYDVRVMDRTASLLYPNPYQTQPL